MITDRQKECYRAYVEEGSYEGAAERLDVSSTTVYEQVNVVREKVEEFFNSLGVIDNYIVGATDFGLIYIKKDDDEIIFVDPDEAKKFSKNMREPHKSEVEEVADSFK